MKMKKKTTDTDLVVIVCIDIIRSILVGFIDLKEQGKKRSSEGTKEEREKRKTGDLLFLFLLFLGRSFSFDKTLFADVSVLLVKVGAEVLLVAGLVIDLEVDATRRTLVVVFLEVFALIFRKVREFLGSASLPLVEFVRMQKSGIIKCFIFAIVKDATETIASFVIRCPHGESVCDKLLVDRDWR